LRRRSISRLLNTGFLHRSIKGIVWAIINTLSARSHQGIVTRCTAVRIEGAASATRGDNNGQNG
ncbi:MAG: hypothetical protein ACXV47_09220, partial [Halobacteriota archaeon]